MGWWAERALIAAADLGEIALRPDYRRVLTHPSGYALAHRFKGWCKGSHRVFDDSGLPDGVLPMQSDTSHPRRHIRRPGAGRRGQSLVEFALILPILLTLTGAAIDVARVYGAWVNLESATRDAAEQVATDINVTTQAGALTRAKAILCTELANTAGFASPPGNPTACTSPAITVTWASSIAAPGSFKYPLVTVTVASTLPFRTLFGYPLFTQNGAWTLGSSQTYSILQGR
jgi:Flp pilus assembly protein TadG